MISQANVHATPVVSYFDCGQDLSLEDLLQRHNLLLEDGSGMGIVNKVTSKTSAIELARRWHQDRVEEFSELWISTDAIRSKEICDYLGKQIYETIDPEVSGWLAFYDPAIYMNWDHECEYLFIVNKDVMEKKAHCRAPWEDLIMEKL